MPLGQWLRAYDEIIGRERTLAGEGMILINAQAVEDMIPRTDAGMREWGIEPPAPIRKEDGGD